MYCKLKIVCFYLKAISCLLLVSKQYVGDVQANAPVQIILPFKDQRSADIVQRQLSNLGKKIITDLHPVFTSKKIADNIKVAEAKPP